MKWRIYLLIDPRSREVRYVGKTVQRPEVRLKDHLTNRAGCHCACWVRSLRRHGLKPLMRVVDEGLGDSWKEAEQFYISFYRDEVGCRLTNQTLGGEGLHGWHHSYEAKQKMRLAKLGKPLSEEHKRKLAVASTGRLHTAEEFIKMMRPRPRRHQ